MIAIPSAEEKITSNGKTQKTKFRNNSLNFQESNYYPPIKLAMLEHIFGYSRQTFVKWEKEGGPNTPKIKSYIQKHPKYDRLNKRLYSVENVRALWKFFREQKKFPTPPTLPLSIALWNNKGGVGKSFLTKELASVFSILMGFKVLVIDCDLQSDSTLLFNCDQRFASFTAVNDENIQPTIRDVIGWEDTENTAYKAELNQSIINLSPTLSVIPADQDVGFIDLELDYKKGLTFNEEKGDTSSLTNIQRILEELYAQYDYDIVLFDCPPAIGKFVHNVLWASDRLIIPIEIEAKCLHSIKRVYDHLLRIAKLCNQYRFDKILGVPNKYQMTQQLHQQAYAKLNELFGHSILSRCALPLAAAVGKSDKDKEPLFMGTFSGTKNKKTPMAKRFSNEIWKIAHEILDMEPHKELFKNLVEE